MVMAVVVSAAAIPTTCAATELPLAHSTTDQAQQAPRVFTCPMHPAVHEHGPGRCPICGMDLTPVEPRAETPESPATATLHVARRSQALLGLRLTTVATRRLAPRSVAWATVVADSANAFIVTAPAEGWIRRIYPAHPGLRLGAGAPLFELYSPELQQRQRDYLDTLNRRDQMLQTLSDATGQNGQLLASLARERKRQRDALLDLGIARANIDALEQYRRPLDSLTVVMPRDGQVVAIPARRGAAVNPGMELLRMVDEAEAQFDVVITPQQLASLRAPVTVEFDVGQHGVALPLALDTAVFDATVQSYTVRVARQMANPPPPGAVIDVALVGAPRETLAVPRAALLEDAEGMWLVSKTGDEQFAARRVMVDATDGDWAAISGGVAAGDSVVVDGQFMLDAAVSQQSFLRELRAR